GMSRAAQCRHETADDAARERPAAPGHAAVVGERFGKTHADTCADARGKADQKSIPRLVSREGGGEQRRQGGHRAVHETGEARLEALADKPTPPCRRFPSKPPGFAM